MSQWPSSHKTETQEHHEVKHERHSVDVECQSRPQRSRLHSRKVNTKHCTEISHTTTNDLSAVEQVINDGSFLQLDRQTCNRLNILQTDTHLLSAQHTSDLAVTHDLTPSQGAVFAMTAIAMYVLQHVLHAVTAVPWSIQPFMTYRSTSEIEWENKVSYDSSISQ